MLLTHSAEFVQAWEYYPRPLAHLRGRLERAVRPLLDRFDLGQARADLVGIGQEREHGRAVGGDLHGSLELHGAAPSCGRPGAAVAGGRVPSSVPATTRARG